MCKFFSYRGCFSKSQSCCKQRMVVVAHPQKSIGPHFNLLPRMGQKTLSPQLLPNWNKTPHVLCQGYGSIPYPSVFLRSPLHHRYIFTFSSPLLKLFLSVEVDIKFVTGGNKEMGNGSRDAESNKTGGGGNHLGWRMWKQYILLEGSINLLKCHVTIGMHQYLLIITALHLRFGRCY